MELTKQEERLISTIRAADQVNPMGAEGSTSEKLMDVQQRIADSWLKSAREAHDRFLEESKSDRVVDLAYYRTERYADGNRYKNGKQIMKRFEDDTGISEPEKPAEKFVDEDEIPGPSKPIEEWTDGELEAYRAYLWNNAEPGTLEYVVKNFTGSSKNIETAVSVIEGIKQGCEEAALREGLRSDFIDSSASELLRILKRRVNEDHEKGGG